jgi:hypothetical protein
MLTGAFDGAFVTVPAGVLAGALAGLPAGAVAWRAGPGLAVAAALSAGEAPTGTVPMFTAPDLEEATGAVVSPMLTAPDLEEVTDPVGPADLVGAVGAEVALGFRGRMFGEVPRGRARGLVTFLAAPDTPRAALPASRPIAASPASLSSSST